MKTKKILHVIVLICFLSLLQSCGMGAKSALGLDSLVPGSSAVFLDIEGELED